MPKSGTVTVLIPLLFAVCAKDALATKSSDILNANPYLVIFPNSLIPGVPLDIRVTILNATRSVSVQAQLLDHNQDAVTSSSKAMSTGETGHIQLQIPMELKRVGHYAVRITGSGGLTFDTSAYIKLEPKGIQIITQTDNTRYSGGQDVKFRSVLLLPNLLGYIGNATVTVYDGNSNKLQVIGPQMTTDGVIEGMMSLSKDPVFGVWRLVTTAQDISHTKTFTVKPYVLPKFSVSIAIIGQNDISIKVNVTARYTFNSKVHGTCKIQIYEASNTARGNLEYEQEIQGSVVFNITTQAISFHFGTYHDAISIRALVTDTASAITMVAEKSNFVAEHRYQSGDYVTLEQFDNRHTFVPGMNFYTTLLAKKKSAVVHTPMKIAVTVMMTVAEVKMCMLSHPPYKWVEKTHIYLPMNFVDTDVTGLAPLNIPIPHNAEELDITLLSEKSGKFTEKFTLYPLTWDDMPMLRLVPSTPHVQIGENITIAVNANKEMSGKLTVEVYARGIALSVATVDVSATVSTTVSVVTTADMVPHAHIVISHITGNNSFMYDYALVKVVGSPTRNQVSVGFNTTTLEPGKGVELTVSADPNSTVYVLTEDQRNRLLGTDNDIFLYQLDDVVSNTGYNVSSSGNNRAAGSKRSLQVPTLPTNYYTTGYSFMDDGVIVLPHNHNILSHTTVQDYTSRDHKYPTDCVNRAFATPNPAGSCVDRINNCNVYTRDVCVEMMYRDWVWENCARFCGFCSAPLHYYTTTGLPAWWAGTGTRPAYTSTMYTRPAGLTTRGPRTTTPLPGYPHVAQPELRNYFPETWIWEKFQVGPSGRLSLPLTVPDSITSWMTSVFATNEKTGFGIDTTKTKITVKKDFFVTMDPPKVIVLGEEFLLQLTVFNYLDTVQQVLVQVNTTDDPSKVMDSSFNVNPGEGHSTFFQITPKHMGNMKITALARAGFFTNRAVDELEKEITVKPNGVHKHRNEQHLVDVVSPTSFSKRFVLADPPNMVPGSKSIKMSITGDFMMNTIEGLDQLISMPYGCGEQTMLNFAPDIYITKYLQTVGKLTKKIQKKTMSMLKSGLQRELSYKHRDGSFSAFGDRDNSGSSWLTAFVLKCFQQADGVLDIDESIKSTGVNWLLNYQNNDGSFYEPGRVIHTNMQAGTSSGLKMTAFILISVLENSKHATSLSLTRSVSTATAYLERNLANVTDMYTMAIVCYALTKSGKPDCFNKLETVAVHDGDKMYWTAKTKISMMSPVTTREAKTRAPSADIEATSYCLLTYLAAGERLKAKPIVKWLISQRNPSGGFRSTQDTVISLQGLSEYAASIQGASHVDFSANGGSFAHAYSVTNANSDLMHQVDVPTTLSELMITATGQGNAVVDVTMAYYVSGIENNHLIAVNSSILNESLNSISVRACIQWNGAEDSGMIVAEVEMPTGFNYDTDWLNRDRVVKKHELIGQNAALYFDGIRAGSQVCPIVKMDRTDPVVKSQACHITVYDYYEPTNQARTRYESGVLKSSTICDVCPECTFCKSGSVIGQIGVGK